jgi:chemotaxis protein MotB
VVIEGHTDARPYSSTGYYSNWDLSTDRANAARRFMEQHGIRSNQVSQLRGFSDQHLRNPKDPFDFANRRVSIIVGFANKPEAEGSKADEGKSPGNNAKDGGAHEGNHGNGAQGHAPASGAEEKKPAPGGH